MNLKTKKIMFVFALIMAVVSCGGGNGNTGNSNTSVSTPVVPTISLFHIEAPNSINLEIPKISRLKKQERFINYALHNPTGWPREYGDFTVRDNETGFNGKEVGFNFSFPRTVTINSGGSAIYIKDFTSESTVQEVIRKTLLNEYSGIQNITLNMLDKDSVMFVGKTSENNALALSKLNGDLFLTSHQKPIVIGEQNYKKIKLFQGNFIIDQDINLDNPLDTYNRIDLISSSITNQKNITSSLKNSLAMAQEESIIDNWLVSLKNNGTITMLGDNSIAMYAKGQGAEIGNKGEIILKGDKSIAAYVSDYNISRWNSNGVNVINDGKIVVNGNDSIAITYEHKDSHYTVLGGVKNNKTIEVFSNNSIGILIDSDSYDRFAENNGIIDLKGQNLIGMYARGRFKRLLNNGNIKIGDSLDRNSPNIGMYTSTIDGVLENNGVITVGKNSIGIYSPKTNLWDYAVKNTQKIELEGDGAIGMYLTENSLGINQGTITTLGSPKGVIGVVLEKGSVFDNQGTIHIDSPGGAAFVLSGGEIRNTGTIILGSGAVEQMKNTLEGNLTPSALNSTLSLMGKLSSLTPEEPEVKLYVDTTGKTNPIEGLGTLGLSKVEFTMGPEVTYNNNLKNVEVSQNVLKPYNDSIKKENITNFDIKSKSLLWEANAELKNGEIQKVTLEKKPYAEFAESEEEKKFAQGLEEAYSNETESRELFNQLNSFNDTQKNLLSSAYKTMSGEQYSNIQHRINSTSESLSNKFSILMKEIGEDEIKINGFVLEGKNIKDEKTSEDYKYSGYGVVFSKDMGDKGMYAGAISKTFNLQDTAGSKEEIGMIKAGIYKKFKFNHGIEWKTSGEVFFGKNEMNRKYNIEGIVYEAKSDYGTYGFGLKNEIAKTIEITENFLFRPYGALNIEYGKFKEVKEKNGEIKLEVEGNDYFSLKPKIGTELIAKKGIFKAGVLVGYKYELGKLENIVNKAKVKDTNTEYYELNKSSKMEKGNLEAELSVGIDTGKYGIMLNGGYETKGKNAKVGIDFGVSF